MLNVHMINVNGYKTHKNAWAWLACVTPNTHTHTHTTGKTHCLSRHMAILLQRCKPEPTKMSQRSSRKHCNIMDNTHPPTCRGSEGMRKNMSE